MLVLSRKKNESIHIGSDVVIHIQRIKGGYVRIAIDAPKSIPIVRSEIRDKYPLPRKEST